MTAFERHGQEDGRVGRNQWPVFVLLASLYGAVRCIISCMAISVCVGSCIAIASYRLASEQCLCKVFGGQKKKKMKKGRRRRRPTNRPPTKLNQMAQGSQEMWSLGNSACITHKRK